MKAGLITRVLIMSVINLEQGTEMDLVAVQSAAKVCRLVLRGLVKVPLNSQGLPLRVFSEVLRAYDSAAESAIVRRRLRPVFE